MEKKDLNDTTPMGQIGRKPEIKLPKLSKTGREASDRISRCMTELSRDYAIKAPLRCGGVSFVYLGESIREKVKVVVKMTDFKRGTSEYEDRVELFEGENRFYQEVLHPRFLQMRASFQDALQGCLVLDYVHEGDLTRWETINPFLGNPALVVAFGLEVLEGLVYLEDQFQRVHKDIKPANILASGTSGLKLIDPVVINEERFQNGEIGFCTLPYAAPEYPGRGELHPSYDMFGLGALMIKLLVGRHPLPRVRNPEQYFHEIGRLPDSFSPEIQKKLPPGLEKVLFQNMLTKDPQQRFLPHQAYESLEKIWEKEAGKVSYTVCLRKVIQKGDELLKGQSEKKRRSTMPTQSEGNIGGSSRRRSYKSKGHIDSSKSHQL